MHRRLFKQTAVLELGPGNCGCQPCSDQGFATIWLSEALKKCLHFMGVPHPKPNRMGHPVRTGIDGMLTSAVLRMVGFCTRHPWPVIIFAAMLAIGSALYTVAHFAITTDTDRLLPQDLPWRQHEQAYRDAFPQDQILAVVEGPTPELVEMAADRLAAELRTRPDRFSSVRRPQGSEFVQRTTLLVLPIDQVSDVTGRFVACVDADGKTHVEARMLAEPQGVMRFAPFLMAPSLEKSFAANWDRLRQELERG